jgi:hypothetical protein
LFLCFNWTPYWGSGGIAPRILDLETRWRWVLSFTRRPLYFQGKGHWYPMDTRLGGPQSRSRRGGEEKNSQCLLGLEPPTFQPVAQSYTTELTRLLKKYRGGMILTSSLIKICQSLQNLWGGGGGGGEWQKHKQTNAHDVKKLPLHIQ